MGLVIRQLLKIGFFDGKLVNIVPMRALGLYRMRLWERVQILTTWHDKWGL